MCNIDLATLRNVIESSTRNADHERIEKIQQFLYSKKLPVETLEMIVAVLALINKDLVEHPEDFATLFRATLEGTASVLLNRVAPL